MRLAEDDTRPAQRLADTLLEGASHVALHNQDWAPTEIDPRVAADQVAEHWVGGARFLVLACAYCRAGLRTFADHPENLEAFLSRLVVRRVLSEDDVLARLKANGKLAMLRKIGQHADRLLQPSLLCLLPAHYSIIYQICLLIEEIGPERAELELSTRPDATRDDVIRLRTASKAGAATSDLVSPKQPFGDSAVELFALNLPAPELRLFRNNYAQHDALHHCLRRPDTAENAGLVGIVPILMLGTLERALLPLLGFGTVDKLFFQSGLDHPEITDREVIVVAKRGNFCPRQLTTFPADLGRHDVLTLADMFFPDGTVRCHLFAQKRTEGWLTFIGEENWNERPSVR